jgi:hypothetical protein
MNALQVVTFLILALAVTSATEYATNPQLDDLEHIIRIHHNGGEDGYSVADKLLFLGITSLKHPNPKDLFFDAYVGKEDWKKAVESGLNITYLGPNPSQFIHEDIRRSTSKYHDYVALNSFLDDIEKNYPTIAKKVDLGKSVGGKGIIGIRISKNVGKGT